MLVNSLAMARSRLTARVTSASNRGLDFGDQRSKIMIRTLIIVKTKTTMRMMGMMTMMTMARSQLTVKVTSASNRGLVINLEILAVDDDYDQSYFKT